MFLSFPFPTLCLVVSALTQAICLQQCFFLVSHSFSIFFFFFCFVLFLAQSFESERELRRSRGGKAFVRAICVSRISRRAKGGSAVGHADSVSARRRPLSRGLVCAPRRALARSPSPELRRTGRVSCRRIERQRPAARKMVLPPPQTKITKCCV